MRRTAVLALAAATLLAGCGGGSAKGPAGQFASLGCASCHTFKAADANGTVGPNLDTLKPTAAAVERQVTNGGGGMPAFKGRLSKAEIHVLALYVARAAAG
jgi:mono/diheme cytochrome c family protein